MSQRAAASSSSSITSPPSSRLQQKVTHTVEQSNPHSRTTPSSQSKSHAKQTNEVHSSIASPPRVPAVADNATSLLVMNYPSADDAHFVFSCRVCHVILGDSLSLVCNHNGMRSITLSGVSHQVNVVSSNISDGSHAVDNTSNNALQASKEKYDKGATYHTLTCKVCSNKIGRMYVSTSRSLDALRDKYTLFVDELESYQLGKVDSGVTFATLQAIEEESNVVAKGKSNTGAESEEITKIQHVLVDLVLRLAELERLLGVPNAQSIPTATDAVGGFSASTNHTRPAAAADPIPHNNSTSPSLSVASPTTIGIKRSAIQQTQQVSSFLLTQPQQNDIGRDKKRRLA